MVQNPRALKEQYNDLKDEITDLKILIEMSKWGGAPDEAMQNLLKANQALILKIKLYAPHIWKIREPIEMLKNLARNLEKEIRELSQISIKIKGAKDYGEKSTSENNPITT